jgi:hypothetical protein
MSSEDYIKEIILTARDGDREKVMYLARKHPARGFIALHHVGMPAAISAILSCREVLGYIDRSDQGAIIGPIVRSNNLDLADALLKRLSPDHDGMKTMLLKEILDYRQEERIPMIQLLIKNGANFEQASSLVESDCANEKSLIEQRQKMIKTVAAKLQM